MLTVLAFVTALGILVTLHEYGHYWVAKRCGVKVLTFSIGFGKPLLQWQRGETTWQIAMIPLGGFVRMLDEREAPVEHSEQSRAFNRKPAWQKMAVVAAGPLANLVLAIGLYALVFVIGVDTLRPHVAEVQPGSPAAQAGLRSGDDVRAVAGKPVSSWDELFLELVAQAGSGEPVALTVHHEGEGERALSMAPIPGAALSPRMLGTLGLSPVPLTRVVDVVQAGSAAERAGLRVGDELLAIDGVDLQGWSQLQTKVTQSGGRELVLAFSRGGQLQQVALVPDVVEQNGRSVGRLGLAPRVDEAAWQSQRLRLELGAGEAISLGISKAWSYAKLTVVMFGRMLIGSAPLDQISGPVSIAVFAGQSAEAGLTPYLNFLAIISLSLAVLNLLPIPLLDGGHLLYYGVELLTGRPVPARVEVIGQRIGLAFLLGLMSLALFNDLNRFLFG
ncbi:RIP metalloprotease RseP [Chitinibacteraceae bacterium HSL-7]